MGLFFKSNSSPKKVKGLNIILAIALLGGLLTLGLAIPNEKASQTFLDCFTVLFTAVIGFFGFEANKYNA